MEANWNQLIERYLNNELSAEGKVAFETELERNAELWKELKLHQLTHELIQRSSLRRLVQQSGKWFHLKKILVKSAIALALAGALAAAVYVLATWNDRLKSEKPDLLEQSMIQKLDKYLAFENTDPQYFQFTGESDVFLSESGVLLSLTDGSFLLNGAPYKGEAIVQWQEVQNPAEIVKAGLSTMSGDRLLETQGMFSLNAFTPDGKKLELSKDGVYVQVPVDEVKKGMKLFEGVPQKDGKIDWQNPVELERLPKQKPMSEMDLYPSKYEPKLNELKWFTEKKKRDSLYLSFEEHAFASDQKTEPVVDRSLPMHASTNLFKGNAYERGKKLFEVKCLTCHQVHKDGTGPKLFHVREKWVNGGAKEGSIYQWVADWSKAASSDPYAREVSNLKVTAMNQFPELEGKVRDMDAIFDYIDGIPPDETDAYGKSHIPPSKVLAIWNPKFDHTILATQEFEDRMKAIHETCDEKVFDVYVKNLGESLWKLDERVVKMGYANFKTFAGQRIGKVKLDDAHQQNLNAFYGEAVKTIRERGKKELETALKKDRAWDRELQDEQHKEVLRKGLRESANLNEEYGFNLANVGKQLGKTLGFQMHGGGTIVNIDKYVWDATVARQSTLITDPETGKTAQITYEPLTMEVKESAQYDKLFIYLFSKEINSYQRLDFREGKLNYNLNGDMNYSAALVGMNEKGYFYHQLNEVKAGDLGMITLEGISEKEFEQRINALNTHRTEKAMSLTDELKWLFKEQANYKVQKQRRENAAFRAQIRPTIYSCMMNREQGGQPTFDI